MTTNLNRLTLYNLFGEKVTQNATVIVIQKSDLLRLTPQSNNSAESLLSAILITALSAFSGEITSEDNVPITSEDDVPITFDNSDAYELLKMFRWNTYQISRNNQKYIMNQVITEVYSADQ